MEYNDFILKQDGRNLTLLDSSKIIINKYDNKVARIVFELDPTIPGRFYFAMKNPVTGIYTLVPILKNHIVIGTNISAYPGRWDSILVAVEDDYEIVDNDIDQSKFTYVCNTFRRIIVRDNFLNEDDTEEIENPTFNEMLEALVKAQDRLENASIEAVEAADSAKADRESVAELIDKINDINTSVEELQDYIDAIKAIRNEVRDYKYEVEDVYEESKQILITINARLDSVEELASEVATNKAHVQEAVNTFDQSYNDRLAEMQNAFDEYIADVNKAQTDAITEITDAGKDVKADVDKSVDDALIAVTTQESNSVEAVNEAKTAAVNAVNTASTTGVKNVTDKETSALAAIEAKQNESTDEIASAKETALADLSIGKDEYVELIDAEKQVAITAVKDSVKDTVDEVAAVKDDAIQGVLDESEVQQNLIAVKTQEALDSIPDTYEEVYEMAREGAEKADAIVCEASGEVIVVNDASDDYLRGLKIYGKTEQSTTKGYQLFDASKLNGGSIGGSTVTNNGDGSFTISGSGNTTASFTQYYDYTHEQTVALLKSGEITLNCYKATNPYLYIALRTDLTSASLLEISNVSNSLASAVITDDMLQNENIFLRLGLYSGAVGTIIPGTIKPMLYQDGDGTWEEFTNNQPSPNPYYPQELVSKGKWGNLASNENIMSYSDDFDTSEKNATLDKPYTGYLSIALYPISGTSQVNVRFYYADGTNGNDNGVLSSSGANNTWHNTNIYVENVIGIKLYNVDASNVRTLGKLLVRYGSYSSVSDSDYRPYTGEMEIENGVYGKNLAPVSSLSYVTYDEKTGTINSATTNNTVAQWAKVMLFKNSTNVKTAWFGYNDNTLGLKVVELTKDDTFNLITVGFNGNYRDAHIFLDCSSLVNGKTYKVVFNVSSLSNNESVISGIMVIDKSITDYTFEPYKAKQSHISLVGDGLNGIKMFDLSLATYTDKDGNMYCADYKDYDRFVNVQRVYEKVFDGTERWITYGTKQYGLYNSDIGALPISRALCSHFIYTSSLESNTFYSGTTGMAFSTEFETLEEFKAFLAEQYANGTPVTMQYILAEPIETPMSDEEISAFKALRSNAPTTTLMNDCDCFSSLSYNADTKTYIKNNTPEPSEESINSAVNAYLDENPVSMVETDPTVPAWAKQATKPSYTASEVGADASGTAASLISSHNVNTESHNDLRILLSELSEKVTTLLNSDDTTLDQTKEIVDYIKANRELIESVTTEKVNVTDIINNLTTNISTKVLSAAQGVALKLLIDDITEALNAHNHDASYGSKTDVENLQADVSALKNIVNTSSITLVDASTGVIYQIVINNGKLTMMEVK